MLHICITIHGAKHIKYQEHLEGEVKDKATPLQACSCPEGSKRLMLPDFKTFGTWRW
jgi:hypothetical protein